MADIQIELGVDKSQAQSSVDKFEGETRKSTDRTGRDFQKNVGDRGAAAFRRVAVAAAAAATAIGAALFSRAAIRGAIEQENAVRRLETALALSGQEVQNNSRLIQEFADEIQRTTTLSNEAAIEQVALATSLGATRDQALNITRAAADLSAALGIGLDRATQELSRSLAGQQTQLSRLIPGIQDLTEEQLRAGAAVDFVAQRFRGAAEQETRTFQGALTQLSESFADLQKAFGQIVTESDVFRRVIQIIRAAVEQLDSFIVSSQQAIIGFGENFARQFIIAGRQVEIFIRDGIGPLQDSFFALGAAAQALNQVFGAEFRGIINAFNLFVNSFLAGVNVLTEGLLRLTRTIQRLDIANVTGLDAIADQLDGRLAESIERTNRTAQNTQQSLQRLLDPSQYEDVGSVTDVFRELFEGIDESSRNEEGELIFDRLLAAFDEENVTRVNENANLLREGLGDSLQGVSDDVSNTSQEIDQDLKRIEAAFNNTFTNATATAFQTFGKQLVEGGLNFKSFVGIALNALGDLAISIGSTVIAASAAIQAIPLGSGILLGAALVAVGGAIKAFSSRFSAAAGGGGPSFSQGGGGFASPSPTIPDSDAVETETGRQAQQQVQVVVQGDILDSEDTGRRLVDILEQNFRSDNSALTGLRTV